MALALLFVVQQPPTPPAPSGTILGDRRLGDSATARRGNLARRTLGSRLFGKVRVLFVANLHVARGCCFRFVRAKNPAIHRRRSRTRVADNADCRVARPSRRRAFPALTVLFSHRIGASCTRGYGCRSDATRRPLRCYRYYTQVGCFQWRAVLPVTISTITRKSTQLALSSIRARPKNRFRNSVSFLLKCKKRGILVGPTFFGKFFRQKHGKNIPTRNRIVFF